MRIAWVLVVAACGSSSSPSKLDGGDRDGGGGDATPPGPTWSVTLATPIQVTGATVDDSGIYISLVDQTTPAETRRIEKRLLATGELDTTFGTGGATAGGPGPLATDAASLYVFDGNALVETKLAKANGTDQAWAVSGPLVKIADPAGLFTGGTDPAGGIQAWGIIRRDPATGAVAFWTRGDYPCTNGLTSSVRAVFIDGAELFATGRRMRRIAVALANTAPRSRDDDDDVAIRVQQRRRARSGHRRSCARRRCGCGLHPRR